MLTRRFLNLFFSLAFALCLVGSFSRRAGADVIIDPAATNEGIIKVSGHGVVTINSDGPGGFKQTQFHLTVTEASTMDIELTWKSGNPDLQLALDGTTLEANSLTMGHGPTPEDRYYAFYDNVGLSMDDGGEHTLVVRSADSRNGQVYYEITISAGSASGGSPSSVPEPATMTLLATGLVGLVGMRRRQRDKTRASSSN